MLTIKQEVELANDYESACSPAHQTPSEAKEQEDEEAGNKETNEPPVAMMKNGCGSSFVYCVGGARGEEASQHPLKTERGFPVFRCDQCEYETFSLATLSSHRKTHAVKKLFQCDICHMKFSQAANMRRHRMRHTGVKPYECRVCCKRFFRKDHLMEHTVTHAKQTPFRCPLCAKDFHRQAHLRDHLSVDHCNDDAGAGGGGGGSGSLPTLADRICRVCGHRAATAKGAKLHYTSRHNRKATNVATAAHATSPKVEDTADDQQVSRAPQTSSNGVVCYLQNPTPYPPFAYPPGIISLVDPCSRMTASPPPPQVSHVSSAYAQAERGGPSSESRSLLIKKEMNVTDEEGETKKMRLASPAGGEAHFPPTPDSSRPQGIAEAVCRAGCLSPLGVGGLQCCHCGIIFPDQTLYFLHKGLHSEGNPWKCNICGELCQDKYEFNAHVLSKAHQ